MALLEGRKNMTNITIDDLTLKVTETQLGYPNTLGMEKPVIIRGNAEIQIADRETETRAFEYYAENWGPRLRHHIYLRQEIILDGEDVKDIEVRKNADVCKEWDQMCADKAAKDKARYHEVYEQVMAHPVTLQVCKDYVSVDSDILKNAKDLPEHFIKHGGFSFRNLLETALENKLHVDLEKRPMRTLRFDVYDFIDENYAGETLNLTMDKLLDLEPVKTYIDQELENIRKYLAEREAMEVTVVSRYKYGSGESDHYNYYANVKITDCESWETKAFTCANIFDGGYRITPAYEISDGIKNGYIDEGFYYNDEHNFKRPLTDVEQRMVRYLTKFPPISPLMHM